jgi:hypothetical protein
MAHFEKDISAYLGPNQLIAKIADLNSQVLGN